jgi:TRAP-type C4-dicarboxylate transport system permease small subunit
MKVLNREKLATLSLFFGTFFNPMGYDAALKFLIDTTGSYWFSISIFYLISLFFFILYFFFARINPLNIFKLRKKSG